MRILSLALVLCLVPNVMASGDPDGVPAVPIVPGTNVNLPDADPASIPVCPKVEEPDPSFPLHGTFVEDCMVKAFGAVDTVLEKDPFIVCTPARIGRTSNIPYFGVNKNEECIDDLEDAARDLIQDPESGVPGFIVHLGG